MAAFIDITGRRFGKLVVLERAGRNKHKKTLWKCLCDCGEFTVTTGEALRSRTTKSCGCLHEAHLARMSSIGKQNKRHGDSFSRLYNIWAGMKTRCFNSDDDAFHRYGGRGITVCDEWRYSFESFRDWALQNGYDDALSIDRINNDGSYCPENCRWVDQQTQAKNRSCSLIFQGEHLSVWAERKNMKPHTLARRLETGWSWEKALNTPVAKPRGRYCSR